MSGIIPYLINVYLIRTTGGEVLIDAGMRWMAGGILRALHRLRIGIGAGRVGVDLERGDDGLAHFRSP